MISRRGFLGSSVAGVLAIPAISSLPFTPEPEVFVPQYTYVYGPVRTGKTDLLVDMICKAKEKKICVAADSLRSVEKIFSKLGHTDKYRLAGHKYDIGHCRITLGDQQITFIPVGFDGSKIRGYRPDMLVIDNFNYCNEEAVSNAICGVMCSGGQTARIVYCSHGWYKGTYSYQMLRSFEAQSHNPNYEIIKT